MLTVENFIIIKKLQFYHHLNSLEDVTLAKEVFEAQKDGELPGLVTECLSFMNDCDITLDPACVSKSVWNKHIKYKIHLQRVGSIKRLDIIVLYYDKNIDPY